jgi:lysophospholipase L1-like esterase
MIRVLLVTALVAVVWLAPGPADAAVPPSSRDEVRVRTGHTEAEPGSIFGGHYVALGDSITGTGSAARHGWVKRFAGTVHAARTTNLAENGWTTGQLLFAVQFHPVYREALRTADVITLNAGMNEFFMGRDVYTKGDCGGVDGLACLRHMTSRFNAWWGALVSELRKLAPTARLVVLTLYHPLEAYDQRLGWSAVVNTHLEAMNRTVASTPGAYIADIHQSYNGPDGNGDPIRLGYILPDAIHATTDGHLAIAELLETFAVSTIDPSSNSGVH